MLEFTTLSYQNLPLLKGCFALYDSRISVYAPACKLMWQDFYHAEFAFASGCLIYKNVIFGETYFNFPVRMEENADEVAAVKEIENYCVERYIPLKYFEVPQEKISILTKRYRYMKLSDNRNYEDYLYVADDFRKFSGKKYAGQRNHIHKFKTLYPRAVFRFFTSEDKPKIRRFFNEFLISCDTAAKKEETKRAKKFILSLPLEQYKTGGYVVDGKIVSLTFGSRIGDTLCIHIEKGLRAYEGVYTATANAFATAEGDADFINREDDSGTRGLRVSKTQYHPYKMLKKFLVEVQNEWANVGKFPVIRTKRLTLSEIKKEDAKAYYDLCTDDERNIYWGYDYKKDLTCELYPNYFYDVQRLDRKKKMCFGFAVRLDGKMIGEGVLYRFTCAGQAEAGIRIDKNYAGHGYGREAFYAMVDWALYSLGLTEVVSKCYHRNSASYSMLSDKMNVTGKDDTFTYFSIKL